MIRKKVLDALVSLGLRRLDAEIYMFLSDKGPQRGRVIADSLNLPKHQLYRSLKNLQGKGMVRATLEYPTRFSAFSLGCVFEQLKKVKVEQARALQESREDLLSNWRSITKKDALDN